MSKLKKANDNIPRTQEELKEIIKNAAYAYEEFLDALKFDWRSDPHSADTPLRVAKSLVNDLFKGCYEEMPKITAFENNQHYDGMVFEGGIPVKSMCSHHHLPFVGQAHVAYIPSPDGKVIGLSKLNRIVEFYSRRPQVQESLTMQIHDAIKSICTGNLGVAVMISATHTCACLRGIKHDGCEMKTSKLSGVFMDNTNLSRNEFYQFIADMGKGK
ncbi:MAG: GTP cyclohydrolase I [Clostridia bacterium]|nr:GTP cyclohydrolase I [Clostridia bacterium]